MDTMTLKIKNEVDAKCIALVIMAQHIKLDAIIKCIWAEVSFCEVWHDVINNLGHTMIKLSVLCSLNSTLTEDR